MPTTQSPAQLPNESSRTRSKSRSPGGGSSVKTWIRALGVASAVGVLWATFRDVNGEAVLKVLASLGPLTLVALVPQISWLCTETLGWRWSFLLLGRKVKFLPLLRIRLATEAVTMTLPGGVVWSESIAPLLLLRHCGVPMTEGVAGIAARKFLLLATQALYVFSIFLFGGRYLDRSSVQLLGGTGLRWLVLGGAILLAAAALGVRFTLLYGSVVSRLHTVLGRIPVARWQRWLDAKQERFAEADDQVVRFFGAKKRGLAGPAAFFWLGWLIESIETWLLLRLVGVDLDFVAVASFEVVVVFIRHVLFVIPAGLGVQEASYVAFLAALGVGNSVELGAAFAVLKRSKEVFWSIVGYALLLSDGHLVLPTNQAAEDAQSG